MKIKRPLLVLASTALLGCCHPLRVIGKESQLTASATRAEVSVQAKTEILKAELSAIRSYHNSLLDTVYWALGTIVGLAVLLVSSSWYTNFKLNESDKARLQEEVDKKIAEAQSLAGRDLQSLADRLDGKLGRDSIAISNRFSAEIDDLKHELRAVDRQLSTDLKDLQDALKIMLTLPDKINRQLNRIDCQTQLNTERIWEIKESPIKVLLSQYFTLRTAIKMRDNDEIARVLARMKDNLRDQVLPSGKKVPVNILEILQNSLVKARDIEHSNEDQLMIDPSLAAEIIDLLSSVPVTDAFES